MWGRGASSLMLWVAMAAAVSAQVRPAPPPKGLLAFQVAPGFEALAQPRFEEDFGRVSLHVPLPAPLRPQAPSLVKALEILLLDLPPADGGETGRQILATQDAVASLEFDGESMVAELRGLPGNLPRATALFREVLGRNRLTDADWAALDLEWKARAHRLQAEGWPALRGTLESHIADGLDMGDAIRTIGSPVPDREQVRVLAQALQGNRGLRAVISGRCDPGEVAPRLMVKPGAGSPASPHSFDAGPEAAYGGSGVRYAAPSWAVAAPRLVFYYRGPALDSPRFPAFAAVGALLAGGVTSLAGRALGAGTAPVPFLSEVRLLSSARGTLLAAEYVVPGDRLEDAALRFLAAGERARAGVLGAVDLDRTRNQAFRLAARAIGESDAFHRFILAHRSPVPRDPYAAIRKALNGMDLAELGQASREFLDPDRAFLLELATGESRGVTPAAFAEAVSRRLPAVIREVRAAAEKEKDIPLPPPVASSDTEESPERIGGVVSTGILRGPVVLLSESHRMPLVWLSARYPGGAWASSGSAPLGAMGVWQRLLGCRDGQDRLLLEHLERLGADVQVEEAADATLVTLVCPSCHRTSALGIWARMLHGEDPRAEDLARAVPLGPLLASIPPGSARDLDRRALASAYGDNHPVARCGLPAPAPGAAEVSAHYARFLRRCIPAMALTGDFLGTELLAVLGEHMAGSEFGTIPLPTLVESFPEGKSFPEGAAGTEPCTLVFPGVYPGEKDQLLLDVALHLLFEGEGRMPGVEVRILSLPPRGCVLLHLEGIGREKGAALLRGFQDLRTAPLNSWRLATAAKQVELEYALLAGEPWRHVNWLSFCGLWKSRLSSPEERGNLLRGMRKESLKELLGRSLGSGRWGLACQSPVGSRAGDAGAGGASGNPAPPPSVK